MGPLVPVVYRSAMTPWGFVVVALVGVAAPFFIAPLIDESHPAFTRLGLGLGLALSLAFGAWRFVDTLARLDTVTATTHGFGFQALMVAIGALAATAIAGILLMVGVAIGGTLSRRFNKPVP